MVPQGPLLPRERFRPNESLARRSPHPSITNAAPALQSQDPSDNRSKSNKADDAILRALGRARSWRVPPHWSKCDWFDELRAIIQYGAACAGLDFNAKRGVPLGAHIYMRAVSAAWTRYRQEWSYYVHASVEFFGTPEPALRPSSPLNDREIVNLLQRALSQLALEDQWLIRHLFWNESGQRRAASVLRISQQCVSKRKMRVLRQLRCLLAGQSQMLSHVFAACWALFDSLDLLPVIDFL